ncbi:unnamed protein product [Peniophora sp. CBMAI 1063]|nr:unnamed protein product [Peniophora sp. CBMAI 1063]
MDELDGFDPTTPAAKLAARNKRTAAAPKINSLNASLNGAGPSKAKPTTVKRPRIHAPPPPDIEVIDTDGPEEIETPPLPTKTRAKAKGKAKADAKPVETVDIGDSEDERAAAARRSRAQKGKGTSPANPASDSRISALEREIERQRTQLEQAEVREQDLHVAYELYTKSKEKEEELVQTQIAQLHSLMAAKDEKYNALEAEFRRSKKATLVPPDGSHFLQILTPEMAEKDKLELQTKLDKAVAASEGKDARIKELEDEVRDLKQERDGEIQRANQLQKELKAYTSGQRPHEPKIVVRGESERGPLNSAAVRMYEELTNILITRVKEFPNELRPGTVW